MMEKKACALFSKAILCSQFVRLPFRNFYMKRLARSEFYYCVSNSLVCKITNCNLQSDQVARATRSNDEICLRKLLIANQRLVFIYSLYLFISRGFDSQSAAICSPFNSIWIQLSCPSRTRHQIEASSRKVSSLAKPTTIEDLPPEMIRELFKRLNPKDLLACSMVHKRLSSLYSGFKVADWP